MLILASSSPRRVELLKKYGIDFISVSPKCDEESCKGGRPSDYCLALSRKKAACAEISNEDDIVIAADTIVVINNKVLGKPKDRNEAFDMLKSLSGACHKVYTGFTIRSSKKTFSAVSVTKVFFRNLSDEMINDYLSIGEYTDKAGAYAIQGAGALFVESIHGDYDNVVGLPVSFLFHELRKHFGYDIFKHININGNKN